jgi:uncharacterized membrane protein (DUF485 family)
MEILTSWCAQQRFGTAIHIDLDHGAAMVEAIELETTWHRQGNGGSSTCTKIPRGFTDMSDLVKIEQDPNYQELVRRRSSLGWMLSLIMLIIYFGFILLVAYAPKFLGTPIGTGVTTIGIPIGLSVIVLAFVLTGIYVRKANSSYDVLIRRIVEDNRS